MIIDCISDLHGHYPKLKGGDLLIVAGDLTAHDEEEEYFEFFDWIEAQKYKCKIVVAGNHDNLMEKENYKGPAGDVKDAFIYLCDSGKEFEGFWIWGSPWTKKFKGMNPDCMAFTVDTEEELLKKWKLIPDNVDILITHSPPKFFNDKNYNGEHCGSESLTNCCIDIKPKLIVYGHIHEGYGHILTEDPINFVNASLVNEHYKPVNKPIRVIL